MAIQFQKFTFGVFISLLITINSYCQVAQLSEKDKVSDFNYLYNELKKSYPYFGVNKRLNGVDWLAKKEEFLNKIKNTKNNKEYLTTINIILSELNNGHTDILPTTYYKYFYKGYKNVVEDYPNYKVYVDELEKTDSIRTKYWTGINNEILSTSEKPSNDENEIKERSEENVNYQFIDSLSVAIVQIHSFSFEFAEGDNVKLKSFFKRAHTYKNIIIDIQGNSGGDTRYWTENIIPYLIKDSICYPIIYGFKNSERLKKFKPDYFENNIQANEISLPNIPEEFKNDEYILLKDYNTILPSKMKKEYQGDIYLLVDKIVYSSAEALAYFFKATKIGLVAGEQTGGDGVGTDPLILTLPKSGIVVRFTGEMGLNPDGSANEETKTIPDIRLKSTTKKDRILDLLNHIERKK